MSQPPCQLALETSGRVASLTLGAADAMIQTIVLPPPTGGAGTGGSSQLMHAIDDLCRAHHLAPAQITGLFLSIGPGSFTGLRIGVTIAKMLAQTLGTRIVAVPTLDVIAHNAPAEHTNVAACLNLKKETVYCGVFTRKNRDLRPIVEPALRTMADLVAVAPRPLAIIGDPLPALPEGAAGVTVLPAEMARGRSEIVWRLGRDAAAAGRFTDPLELLPLYVRPPEAVELWDQRHGKA